MAEDVKIPVTTPGMKAATVDAKELAKALDALYNANVRASAGQAQGQTTLAAGLKDAKTGAQETTGAVDKLGRSVEANRGVFASWGVGIAAAVSAGIEMIGSMIQAAARMRAEFRANYDQFIQMSRAPSMVELARARGISETAAARGVLGEARAAMLEPSEVLGAALPLEQALQGTAAAGQIGGVRGDVLKFMRAYGVSGPSAAGLAIEAVHAGKGTRAGIQGFLGKAAYYGRASRLGVRGLTTVVQDLMGEARVVGLDPERFFAMASAMSQEVGSEAELRQRLSQLIRMAGRPSAELAAYAAATGRRPADLGAEEVLQFQLGQLTGAQGPQAMQQVAMELGIPSRALAGIVHAYGPETQAATEALYRGAGAGGFEAVETQFAGIAATPAGRLQVAEQARKNAEALAGEQQATWSTILKQAEVKATGMMAAGEETPIARWRGKEALTRWVAATDLRTALEDIAKNESLPREVREAAQRHAAAVIIGRERFARSGGWEPEMIRGAQFVGGTHFHGTYEDPAGKRVPSDLEH